MILMRVEGETWQHYGGCHIKFQVDDSSGSPCFQATIVLGKRRLARILFRDLAQLQECATVLKRGFAIMPPNHAAKWVANE